MDLKQYRGLGIALRCTNIAFAVIIVSCLSYQGWVYNGKEQRYICLFNNNIHACTSGIAIGALSLITSAGYLALDFVLTLPAKRYFYVELVFSFIWSIFYFIEFSVSAVLWASTPPMPVKYNFRVIQTILCFYCLAMITWFVSGVWACLRVQETKEYVLNEKEHSPVVETTSNFTGTTLPNSDSTKNPAVHFNEPETNEDVDESTENNNFRPIEIPNSNCRCLDAGRSYCICINRTAERNYDRNNTLSRNTERHNDSSRNNTLTRNNVTNNSNVTAERSGTPSYRYNDVTERSHGAVSRNVTTDVRCNRSHTPDLTRCRSNDVTDGYGTINRLGNSVSTIRTTTEIGSSRMYVLEDVKVNVEVDRTLFV